MVDHYLFTTVLRHVVIVVCCIAEWSELRAECEHVLGIFISFAYVAVKLYSQPNLTNTFNQCIQIVATMMDKLQ